MPGIHNGIGTTFRSSAFGGGAPPVNPDFVSTWDTTKAGSASDTVVLPLLSGGTYSGTIDWGDSTTSALSYANRTHVYASSGIYTITISGTIEGWTFAGAVDYRKITDISNWGTLALNGNQAFHGCANLDISATDAPTFLPSSNTYRMFRLCTSLTTPDFSKWDVTSMNYFGEMFVGCTNFNGDVTTWDMSNATFTASMFSGCFNFNQDISNWDVSNVTTFGTAFSGTGMFENAIAFNQPIGKWNMGSATTVTRMLINADAFDQDLSNWDIDQISVFTNFMQIATGLSTANYDATLIGWEATLQAAYPSGVGYTYTISINFGGSQYSCKSLAARNSLITTFGWTITDGGQDVSVNCDFVTTWDTTQAGSAPDTVVLPLLSGGTYSGTIDWGDGGATSVLSYANRTHVYASSGTYTITITGTIEGWQFNNAGDIAKITDIPNWGTLTITTDYAFYGCSNLDISATDAPTISTTSLYSMFRNCTSLTTPDFSGWDVSSVENFGFFLRAASSANPNVESWDMSSATNISQFGRLANAFDQNLEDWDITNLSNAGGFLQTATGLSTSNYDATLIGWEATLQAAYPSGVGYPHSITITFGGSQYTGGGAADAARASLISTFGWTITDGGAV